jgi:NADH dehydrogenase
MLGEGTATRARQPASSGEGKQEQWATTVTETARVVVVGGGYSGFVFARTLERRLPASAAEVVLVSPQDYMLYTALLPQVAAETIHPRRLAVGFRRTLRRTRLQIGAVTGIGVDDRRVTVRSPDGDEQELSWDRLVLAPGAVTRWFDIPGLREHAFELKTLADAVRLHDHVVRLHQEADTTDDPEERAALSTFVVIGAGYTGTELAAQMQRTALRAGRRRGRRRGAAGGWVLLDVAGTVLPGLDPRLGRAANRVLERRGVEVRLGTSVTGVDAGGVTLTDGAVLPCRTMVLAAGVVADPLVAALGLPTVKGRLRVDARFRVPDAPGVFAFGDAAAVPDLTRPSGALAAQTAQHATREGHTAAINVAASLGVGRARDYRHSDLGFVVDLGGMSAVANPLRVAVRGPIAAAVTRAYHLYALPTLGNRVRLLTDWVLDSALGPQLVALDLAGTDAWTKPPPKGAPGHAGG